MKRAFLLKSLAAACLSMLLSADAGAQYIEVMGRRLIVNGSGVSGIKIFTYSSDGTGGWGRALDSTWQNVPIVNASPDITACSAINPITGNSWVLIERGNCEFGAKALAAQNAGAKGVIIYNHNAGAGPVGMGAGAVGSSVNIPVLMVSNEDGKAMRTAISGGPVTISLTRWGFGYAHDLAIVPGSTPAGSNAAIPVTQTGTGTPDAYKFYAGAFVANTGTSTETNIKIKQTVTFTPTGGTPTLVSSDSATLAQITVGDSILEAFSPRSTSDNRNQTGRYTITHTISADAADDNPSDNSISTYVDVSPQIFSKGGVNTATQMPMVTRSYRLGTGNAFSWGPIFYVNKGGYALDKVVCTVSDGDTSSHSLNGALNAFIFKWVDGSNGGTSDGFMQSRELSLKSIATRALVASDSNNQPLALVCGDANGLPGTVVTEDNSWYWVAVDMPGGWFLGCDENVNYYNRTNAAQAATNPVNDYWSPLYPGAVQAMQSAITDSVRQIPFGGTAYTGHFADSIAYQNSRGSVPAVVLFIGQFPTTVKAIEYDNQVTIYPNPATSLLNVDINLNNGSAKYIRVIDGMGRKVFAQETGLNQSQITISTSAYAPGNYYLLVGTDSGVISRPFTVSSK